MSVNHTVDTGTGTRTRTAFQPGDFKSPASTNSAIPAWDTRYYLSITSGADGISASTSFRACQRPRQHATWQRERPGGARRPLHATGKAERAVSARAPPTEPAGPTGRPTASGPRPIR